jgi:hypothetical protein
VALKKGTMLDPKGPLPNFERLIEHSALCIEHSVESIHAQTHRDIHGR